MANIDGNLSLKAMPNNCRCYVLTNFPIWYSKESNSDIIFRERLRNHTNEIRAIGYFAVVTLIQSQLEYNKPLLEGLGWRHVVNEYNSVGKRHFHMFVLSVDQQNKTSEKLSF